MTDYDAEEEFENYLCFSAMLAQRNEKAIETLEQIDSEDTPEYVSQVITSVMKPLQDLMEYKIKHYPYTPENLTKIVAMCGGKEAAADFLESQMNLQQDYYALLPLVMPKEEADSLWKDVENKFTAQKMKLDGING